MKANIARIVIAESCAMGRAYGTQLYFIPFYPGLKPGATKWFVPTELKGSKRAVSFMVLKVNPKACLGVQVGVL